MLKDSHCLNIFHRIKQPHSTLINITEGQTIIFRLNHWGWVTHICVGNLTIISTDNGLSPGRRQAIIWTNAGILLIRTSGTNFSEILIDIHTFSFKKIHLKMSSAKWRPLCLGLNMLKTSTGLRIGMVKLRMPILYRFIITQTQHPIVRQITAFI